MAARELAGTPGSPVQTLRATERLTGMPVLLHVLPHALSLPQLPEHPNLLPIIDSGMDGGQVFVVTELPLGSGPANDALLAARGALSALTLLHEHGVVHGGIGPAQLWSTDGHVALAGAGLPWREQPSEHDDLHDLALTLQQIGPFPPALRPLLNPGEASMLSAREALALLDTPLEVEAAKAAEPAAEEPAMPAPTKEAHPPAPESGLEDEPFIPGPVQDQAAQSAPPVQDSHGPESLPQAPVAQAAPEPASAASELRPEAVVGQADVPEDAPSEVVSAGPEHTPAPPAPLPEIPAAPSAVPEEDSPAPIPAAEAKPEPAEARKSKRGAKKKKAGAAPLPPAEPVQSAEPPGDIAPIQEPAPVAALAEQEPEVLPPAQEAPHDGTPIVLGEPGAQPATLPRPGQHLQSVADRTVTEGTPSQEPPVGPPPAAAPDLRAAAPLNHAPDLTATGTPPDEPAEPEAPRLPTVAAAEAVSPVPPAAGRQEPAPPTAAPDDASPAAARPSLSPFSTAPAGAAETPQERRKRQNEERRAQAMLDAKAAAERKAKRLRAEAEARQAEQGQAEGTPIRIGVSDDLPAWTPPAGEDATATGSRRLRMRDVARLPESLRRPAEEALPEPQPEPVSTRDAGHLPSRRVVGEPIRIGWDEDDSWRVVKAAPAPPPPEPFRLPRWVLPLLAALLLIGGTIWAYRNANLTPPRAAPTGQTQQDYTVQFVIQGTPGVKASLRLEDAPAGANLTPGQDMGTAPGAIKFPIKGTYRLRVKADGYSPISMNVTVPHPTPVTIGTRN